MIDDAFAGLRLSFAPPKARPAASQFVAAFVEEAKASGVVQSAIDAAGVGGDVKVAPAEWLSGPQTLGGGRSGPQATAVRFAGHERQGQVVTEEYS